MALRKFFLSLCDKIRFEYRACLFCGSIANESELLCAFCWNFLKSRIRDEFQLKRIRGLKVFFFLGWQKDKDSQVSRLISELKHNSNSSDWLTLARLFHKFRRDFEAYNSEETEKHSMGPMELILVPAPTSAPDRPNHAEAFARALSRCGDGFVVPGLQLESEGTQKSKNVLERRSLRMTWSEKNSNPQSRWIFVDDVVTTGSTAMAAYLALGSPADFEVWCVAHRLSHLEAEAQDGP